MSPEPKEHSVGFLVISVVILFISLSAQLISRESYNFAAQNGGEPKYYSNLLWGADRRKGTQETAKLSNIQTSM